MPANHESKLFIVRLRSLLFGRLTYKVFRTRKAARDFRDTKNAGKRYTADVLPAQWGPDA